MNNRSEQKKRETVQTLTKVKKKESQKKGRMILKYLTRQRIRNEGSAETLIKRKREKEDKLKAEKEFLGNFDKVRKVFRSINKKENNT